jgi:surface polysaccharide O-acyltransferase-like enzyme
VPATESVASPLAILIEFGDEKAMALVPMSRASSSTPGSFLTNVHLFRGVAILAVVATHVLFELNWSEQNQGQFKVCLSLVQNGTVWFVFVAGLLFRHLAHKFEYRTYLLSKLKYVILPYVVVSLPYVALQYQRGFGLFRADLERTVDNTVLRVLLAYVWGEQMPIPLWFIPMISVAYLLAPVFLWLDRQRWGYWTIPPLLLLASLVHRPHEQTMLRQTVPYFLPVYLVGMWVARNMTVVMTWTRRLRWPALATSAAILAYEVLTRERPGAIESLSPFSTEAGIFDFNIYMKLLLSLVVLEALLRCPQWLSELLDPLATLSFGIFFVHFYLVYFARDLRQALSTQWPGSVWMLTLLTLVTVYSSVAVVSLVRRVFGRKSRYIVGC